LQSPPGPSATLVTNLNQSTDVVLAANGTNWAAASSFTTASGTHVLDSITVSASSSTGGTSELRIRADNGGVPGTLLSSLGSQSISGASNVTYNSGPTSLVLQPSTKYWVTLGETGSGDFGWNGTLSTSETSPTGWTIGDAVLQKPAASSTWQNFGPPNYSGLFSVTAHAQGAAAGVPEPAAVLLFLPFIAAASAYRLGRRRRRPACKDVAPLPRARGGDWNRAAQIQAGL
jgi:hypothetical protein